MSARRLASVLAAFVVVLGLPSCGPGQTDCMCLPCTTAVTLTVIDGRTGGPITTFVLDALLNGDPIGQPPECSEETRTGNSCSFGQEPGLYHLVVGAPGYETRETLVRQPDQGSGDICCRACLSSQEITLELDAL